MKKLYISFITEYESGWGQRPDGLYLCEDLDELNRYIKERGDSGSYECFWRCSKPEEIFAIDNEAYAEFSKKMNETDDLNKYKVIWVKNHKNIDTPKGKVEFFTKA